MFSIIFFFLLAQGRRGNVNNAWHKGERWPDGASICSRWPKVEIGCRKVIALNAQCKDTSICSDPNHDCTDAEIAKRAGNTCSGFPWYNGGYPLNALHWDSEKEFYQCTKVHNSSDFCEEWISLEDGKDEWESGPCRCNSVVYDNHYNRSHCAQWSCDQIEVQKCGGALRINRQSRDWDTSYRWGHHGFRLERFPSLDTDSIHRRGYWDHWPYQCWCYDDNYWGNYRVCGPEVETETSECECTKTEEGICVNWKCIEKDDAGNHAPEHEKYAAVIEGGMVTGWKGIAESETEFEYIDCECTQPSVNGKFCIDWTCYEKGMAYHLPGVMWFPLHWLLMVPVVFLAGVDGGPCLLCFAFVWVTGFTILFVWLGGVLELLIALLPFLCCGCCYYGKSMCEGDGDGKSSTPETHGKIDGYGETHGYNKQNGDTKYSGYPQTSV